MSLLSRELAFILMLVTSVAVGCIVRLLGHIRYKKELLSLVGLIQMVWFCQWDTMHLLVMMSISTLLIKNNVLGPRSVFVYCFLHRLFFSSSKYFGLTRDESNLANATMFIATLKMVTVAYEVSDFRASSKSDRSKDPRKAKWLNLDLEPSAYDILCYMTCFAALFTGPIFRYKTYHDMLYKYLDVPFKSEITSKLVTCGICYAYYTIVPFNFQTFDEGFDEYNYFVRLLLMTLIALTQVAKYAVAWLLAESVCVLIGLGAYPSSTNPVSASGPTQQLERKNNHKQEEFNYETISTMKLYDAMTAPTIRGTLTTWNSCTQWWLAYFIYSSTIFPRHWRIVRAFNVMIISAAWHGIKPGYFLSFPMLTVCLIAEDLWTRYYFQPSSKLAHYLNETFHWLFFKMFVTCFLICVFILQDSETIFRFAKSTYFYGYVIPIFAVLTGLILTSVFPKPRVKSS